MNLIILDTETTGLNPFKHELVEIGAVRMSDGETFEVKVHPMDIKNADPKALEINGYNKKEWIDDGYLLENGLKLLTEFVGKNGSTLMTYNISFDKAFLEKAYRECDLPYPFHYAPLDLMTWVWSKVEMGGRVPSLKDACLLYGIDPEPSVHRALQGALTAFEVYKKLIV